MHARRPLFFFLFIALVPPASAAIKTSGMGPLRRSQGYQAVSCFYLTAVTGAYPLGSWTSCQRASFFSSRETRDFAGLLSQLLMYARAYARHTE